jgi:predicted adenylyl cyclase CyaB
LARNIEIKARVRNRKDLIDKIETIADSSPVVIDQDDTFFHCSDGRLKLRELSGNHGELIYYHRPNISGPKTSTYIISEISESGKMRDILSSVLGVKGRIRKKRILYMCGSTRIHIDNVEIPGNFVELEVVLDDAETVETGQRIAEELMIRLDINKSDLLEGAYVDMLPVNFS